MFICGVPAPKLVLVTVVVCANCLLKEEDEKQAAAKMEMKGGGHENHLSVVYV